MDDYSAYWNRNGRSLRQEGWADAARPPTEEGSYDVVFTSTKQGKAWFDGVRFFVPDQSNGKVFAWRKARTRPAHEMNEGILPLAVADFSHYESATAEEEALKMLAENALVTAGLTVEITMSRVSSAANGAMSIQRVLAHSENQVAVFDGTPEIKALSTASLDRPLEFNRAYTIDFKEGQGQVFDGIRYRVQISDHSGQHDGQSDEASMRAGMLTLPEKTFIEREILKRLQFLTPLELYRGLGNQAPVDRAVDQALAAAQEHFSTAKPRTVSSISVSDDLAAVARPLLEEAEDLDDALSQDERMTA